jgi:pimeloyl-ACP methyl ester carboxylesterase
MSRPAEPEGGLEAHVEFTFRTGTHSFHRDRNFNFQLNRQIKLGGAPMEDIKKAAVSIQTLDDWKREFLALAKQAEAGARLAHAACCYRAAEFFMPPGDPDKHPAFKKAAELFRMTAQPDFASGMVEEHRVPYENTWLPAWRLPALGGSRKKGVVVLHGGFDSTIEELYAPASGMRNQGFDIVMFEGPGQGSVLHDQGLPMTPEWEKPVAAVLNHFNLSGVTLVGVSLGGYLAPRAAAMEPRVHRVVAWDVLYDFFEVLSRAGGPVIEKTVKTFVRLGARAALNRMVRLRARFDPCTAWGAGHGMRVLGADSPFDFFERARQYTMRGISELVCQDMLVLAGAEDHFIPMDLFHRQARELTGARSYTGRVFTWADMAEDHCQCGNLKLALDVISAWTEERGRTRGA